MPVREFKARARRIFYTLYVKVSLDRKLRHRILGAWPLHIQQVGIKRQITKPEFIAFLQKEDA